MEKLLIIVNLNVEFILWTGQEDKLTSLLAVGDMAPPPSSQTIDGLKDVNVSKSTVSFIARVANGNRLLYSRSGTDFSLVKEHNDSNSRVNTSDNGNLSYLKYSASDNVIIESEQAAKILSEIAIETQQAPSLPEGVIMADLESDLSSNDFRQVLFNSILFVDGITEANNEGVWLYDPTYGLSPVIREGSSVQIAVDDIRMVASVRSQINYRGEVSMLASIQDNSASIIAIKKNPSEILYYDGFE